jgi:hypothetical protein
MLASLTDVSHVEQCRTQRSMSFKKQAGVSPGNLSQLATEFK